METAEVDLDPTGVTFPDKVARSASNYSQATVNIFILYLLYKYLLIPVNNVYYRLL